MTDVFQMKNALESQGGVINTYASIIDVSMEKQPKLSGQLKGCSITQFNNFIFEEDGLRIFKAYGFGEERISTESLNAISKHMSEICGYQIKAFPTTPETRGLLKKTSSHLLSCTDPDCVKQFKKQDRLLDHLVKGDHLYDSDKTDSTEDTTKRLWAEKCVSVRGNQHATLPETELIDPSFSFTEPAGYALKKRKKGTRFSFKVKDYILNIFEAGETTGKKANPYSVSKNMRYEVDENGHRLFKPSEWLSQQQVRGLFANFATKKQPAQGAKRLKLEEAETDYDEDLQNTVSALLAAERMDVMATICDTF